MLLIRDQRNRKLVLGAEGLLGFYGVCRDAEYRGSFIGKRALEPREVDRFPGAAGGVGSGVEEQHQFLARIVGRRDVVAAIAGQVEGGSHRALDKSGSGGRLGRSRQIGF